MHLEPRLYLLFLVSVSWSLHVNLLFVQMVCFPQETADLIWVMISVLLHSHCSGFFGLVKQHQVKSSSKTFQKQKNEVFSSFKEK